MRRKNLRTLFFISLLITLAGLIVGFESIDLPGNQLDRNNNGPVGLLLGLDLKGGAHLVYSAEQTVNINMVLDEPKSEQEVRRALDFLAIGSANINTYLRERFTMEVPNLEDNEIDQFVVTMEEEIGPVEDFVHYREERTKVSLVAKAGPVKEQITSVFSGLGYDDFEVSTSMSTVFIVTGLPDDIDPEEIETLRNRLDEIYPLNDIQVYPADHETQLALFFHPLLSEGLIQSAIAKLGHAIAVVLTEDGERFTTMIEALDDSQKEELKEQISDETYGLDSVDAVSANIALLEVTFVEGQDQSDLEEFFVNQGRIDPRVTATEGRDYQLELASLDYNRDISLQEEMIEQLGRMESFDLIRQDTTDLLMDGVVDTIERRVNAFGITEPIVQRLGEDRVIVQLPGVSDSNINVTFSNTVQEARLVKVIEESGIEDISADFLDPVQIPNGFEILIRNITLDENAGILARYEEKFGQIIDSSFVAVPGTMRVIFQNQASSEDLRFELSDMGYETPIITPAMGSKYRIKTPSRSDDQNDELKELLSTKLSTEDRPILVVGFEISGGAEGAKKLIGETAQLLFKERTCLNQDCSSFKDRAAVGNNGESLTGDNLSQAFASTQQTTGEPIVNFVFDGDGTRVFRDLTTRIAGDPTKCISHFLDGEMILCPVVNQPIIAGSGFISGNFTFSEVRTLSIQLQSGSLPVALELVRESTVDSLLGDESLKASLKAAAVGLGLIGLFMLLYYRIPGIVSSVALLLYGLMLMSVFKMIPVTLTLSGLAGLVLSIGMAVDANILIFERLKEELRSGRSLMSAIEIGFRRAWPAIRDSNLSTLITCGILFFFGRELGEPRITGFAITLAIGVSLSMFTAIVVTRALLTFLVYTPLGTRLKFYSPEGLKGVTYKGMERS